MSEITIITTYYNNKDLLKKFIENFLKIDNCRLIIVDDGSQIYPAIDVVSLFNDERISLYRIKKDLGFNSHGARNLGMLVSKTKWNLLTDSDIDPLAYNIDIFDTEKMSEKDIYSFTINSILIHRDTYFSCKGYDEEFVNLHYGDKFFLQYLERKYNFMKLNKNVDKWRKAWKVVFSRTHDITTYDEERRILYQPVPEHAKKITELVKRRYLLESFDEKKIINFEWEKLI